ncbi:EsaB/YukD family protein [Heyndrickxia acidiproducens]|uniref:EsaB/YukD family protein n=1 Tax=Heyndrickxia acidiproducens TaxID=1121084 RepID=UPI00037C3987|nr:EsaB/YukD family protein [Heyndrickxia acidiproducens]
MPVETHINVTVDFEKWQKGKFDVRIPVHQPVRLLLPNLIEALRLEIGQVPPFAIKIPAKQLLLADDDRLTDYPVTNGDILVIL